MRPRNWKTGLGPEGWMRVGAVRVVDELEAGFRPPDFFDPLRDAVLDFLVRCPAPDLLEELLAEEEPRVAMVPNLVQRLVWMREPPRQAVVKGAWIVSVRNADHHRRGLDHGDSLRPHFETEFLDGLIGDRRADDESWREFNPDDVIDGSRLHGGDSPLSWLRALSLICFPFRRNDPSRRYLATALR